MPDYYICQVSDMRAVAGPFPTPYMAAALIDLQDEPAKYGTASRYQLAKIGRYTKSNNGENALCSDVLTSDMGYKSKHPRGWAVVACANCGNELKHNMFGGWIHKGYDEPGAVESPMTPSMEICGKPEPAAR